MTANQGIEQLSQTSKQVFALFERVPVENYRRLILFLSLLWLLWVLADIFWMLMPIPQDSQNISRSVSYSPAASKNFPVVQIDLSKMQSWHLFGEQNGEQAVEAHITSGDDVDEDAQETRLSLRLLGIIEAKNPNEGWAIIEHQSKSDLYKVGQALPVGSGVSLSRVLSDRAIIDNRGKYEALFLYDEKGNRIKAPVKNVAIKEQDNKKSSTLDQRKNKKLSKMAADYRQQLMSDPMSLSEVIKISPANDKQGNLMGYRVRPGKHRQQFKEFGLRSGDVVTSINGVELTDPSNAMSLYQDMQNTTEATIEVLRGDETISLMIGIE